MESRYKEILTELLLEKVASKSIDTPTFENGKHIVILQRGWVVVGNIKQSGTSVTINDASVIRVWGTTKGLGELALEGPTESTKLDPCGTVKSHELAIVATLKCEESKW